MFRRLSIRYLEELPQLQLHHHFASTYPGSLFFQYHLQMFCEMLVRFGQFETRFYHPEYCKRRIPDISRLLQSHSLLTKFCISLLGKHLNSSNYSVLSQFCGRDLRPVRYFNGLKHVGDKIIDKT